MQIVNNEEIKSLIYTVRGKQVMLDSDVAMQSTEISNNLRGGRRYLPYVFTEQGIAMPSGLLKNAS